MGEDRIDLQPYARLVARLTHRFADRSGVLEARGLDEERFDSIEEAALASLEDALRRNDWGAVVAFITPFLDARRGLRSSMGASEPATQAAPTVQHGAVATRPMAAISRDQASPDVPDDPATVDVLDLMETLHSTAGGRPPSSS
jgi:hypothetical protein